jgi:hypothetical protein
MLVARALRRHHTLDSSDLIIQTDTRLEITENTWETIAVVPLLHFLWRLELSLFVLRYHF